MEDTKRCARVDLVGVETIKSDMRRHPLAVWPEINFFFAIAPPSGHFREKRSSVWSFATVDLGGVDKVSERFGQLFFNMGVNGAGNRNKRGVASTGRDGDTSNLLRWSTRWSAPLFGGQHLWAGDPPRGWPEGPSGAHLHITSHRNYIFAHMQKWRFLKRLFLSAQLTGIQKQC